MKIGSNPNWPSFDFQTRIDPSPITIIKKRKKEEKASNIIRVNMCRNPESAVSKTYELKMATFNHGRTE